MHGDLRNRKGSRLNQENVGIRYMTNQADICRMIQNWRYFFQGVKEAG